MSLRVTPATLAVIITATVMLAATTAARAETVEDAVFDAYLSRDGHKSLSFPAQPEAFGYARASKMFKPDGPGPFPGLVILPTCSGHAGWLHSFDWATPALARGYAVLVVDPLTPRSAGVENCTPPAKGQPGPVSSGCF